MMAKEQQRVFITVTRSDGQQRIDFDSMLLIVGDHGVRMSVWHAKLVSTSIVLSIIMCYFKA